MFAKIVKGKDLTALESEVNKFIADHQFQVAPDENATAMLSQLNVAFPGMQTTDPTVKKRLKIYNVQQFVIGEVDPKTISFINQQPVPTYSFCLLLICGYE